MKSHNLQVPEVLFVDPDQVEPHNVGRQMFVPADVGAGKAQLLSRRFNAALGLDIAWDAAAFAANRHANRQETLLVGCVDNHLARRALAEANRLWLDCGNHSETGQVIIGSTGDASQVRREFGKAVDIVSVLPNATLLFPELLEPDGDAPVSPSASCAELVEAGVQHLLINDAVAITAAGYLYRLLYRKPLHSFMSYVSLEAVHPVPISWEEIKPYLHKKKETDHAFQQPE